MTLDYQSTIPSRKRYSWVLIVVNAVVFVATAAYLLPLAVHIFGCTYSEKWCHLAAFVFGVPDSVLVLAVGAIAASNASADDEFRHRGNLLALLVPTFCSIAILAALGIAVIVDS